MFQAKITLKRTFIELDKKREEEDEQLVMEMKERKNSWRTPKKLFNWVLSRWDIVIDLAASRRNHLMPSYFDKSDDALSIDWTAHIVKKFPRFTAPLCLRTPYAWLNPPYEKGQLDLWFEKCDKEAAKGVIGIVALVPAFAGEHRWKKHVWGKAREVWAIDGRLRFGDSESGVQGKGATFGSMLIVWAPRYHSDENKVIHTVIRCDHPSFTD